MLKTFTKKKKQRQRIKFLSIIFTVLIVILVTQKQASANLLEPLIDTISEFINETTSTFENLFEDINVFAQNQETETVLDFENRTQATYKILRDAAEEASTNEIISKAKENSLSNEGQEELNSISEGVRRNITSSIEINDETQGTDVTQQILRQLSEQYLLGATREGILIQQGLEAEIARDISNVLNSEQLNKMNEEEIRNRRTNSTSSNFATYGWGQIIIPGLNLEN